ncbi:MAG: SEL1-like repeat protein [Planctomycetes bacterium]|nr:SEL1-like repeat protein [Planctomycetota bacterium]
MRPSQIGRYPITGTLGQGGSGVVYASVHPELGWPLAIKVLLADPTGDRTRVLRLQREGQALAQLEHPNVVKIVDAGEQNGVPWVAMRRIEGQTLEERLRFGPLPPDEVVQVAHQLCSALQACHKLGLIHRDLKPENLIQTPAGQTILTDFGLAKDTEVEASVLLSKTGGLMGTPGYWAPEQAIGDGAQATPATDIYGLGATLYALLTGRPPVVGATLSEILVATREVTPDPPSALAGEVPAWLDRVVLRCLAKAPEARFGSVAELKQALLGEGSLRRPRKTRWIALLALGLVGAATLGRVYFLRDAPTTQAPELSAKEALKLGRAALKSEAYAEAKRLFLLAAKGGETKAMLNLGRIYANGYGLASDERQAVEWVRRAADAGDAAGMRILGDAYLEGAGVQENGREAVSWWEKAVKAGDRKALNSLGNAHSLGEGVERDRAKAAVFYEQGVEAGDVLAMGNLGVFYFLGRGIAKDTSRAAALFREGAEAGDPFCMGYLASLYESGDGIAKDAPESVKWSQRGARAGDAHSMGILGNHYYKGSGGLEGDPAEATRWYLKGAKAGGQIAMFNLGWSYEFGGEVELNLGLALKWYRLALKAGNARAMGRLADAYLHGELGCKRDPERAVDLYRRGAELSDPRSLLGLGFAHQEGYGPFEPNRVEAGKWYRKAAAKGVPAAMTNLGGLYSRGVGGVKQDFVEACFWFRKGAQAGDPLGMTNLGLHYANGKGVERDFVKANEWLEKGALGGNAQAMRFLGVLYKHGWGVTLDRAKAASWFRRALQAGYEAAQADLDQLATEDR